jgi:hypothetical protein
MNTHEIEWRGGEIGDDVHPFGLDARREHEERRIDQRLQGRIRGVALRDLLRGAAQRRDLRGRKVERLVG